MVIKINGHARGTRRLMHYEDEGARVMAIHTGLSVTVAGYLVEIERDDAAMRARVVVRGEESLDGISVEAVKVAADLLAARARRFLGASWKVDGWRPPRKVVGRSA